MGDIGTGSTIAFATSGFTAELLTIDGAGLTREAVDNTHLGTVGGKEYLPGKLHDGGEVEIEFAFNPDEQPPYAGSTETVTVTFPVPSGGSTGASFAASMFVVNFSWGVALEERMTANATLKVSGDVTWTAST